MDEQIFQGGLNEVISRGDRVYRPARPWSEAVMRLLEHVRRAGFDGVPEPFGIDAGGYEVLGWIRGTVADASGQQHDEPTIQAVARLLRRYHDATTGFDASALSWQFAPERPAEVILHGDAAPYNCVFLGGSPVAWIDFDTARPGPRLHDVAYSAYRFCLIREPLVAVTPADTARVRTFAEAYGLSAEERFNLRDAIATRLRWLAALIRERAASGDVAFARHLAAGHAELYAEHAEVIERSAALRDALASRG
jgi:Ser/Thr protein kinase RdoA (MazF antagonist)